MIKNKDTRTRLKCILKVYSYNSTPKCRCMLDVFFKCNISHRLFLDLTNIESIFHWCLIFPFRFFHTISMRTLWLYDTTLLLTDIFPDKPIWSRLRKWLSPNPATLAHAIVSQLLRLLLCYYFIIVILFFFLTLLGSCYFSLPRLLCVQPEIVFTGFSFDHTVRNNVG